MKRTRYVAAAAVMAVGLFAMGATRVHAQGIGLLSAETSEARELEWLNISAGAVIGEDRDFYGGRSTFWIVPEVRSFVDLGFVSLRDREVPSSTDIGAQAGLIYALPTVLPFDNSIRGAVYGATGDRHNIVGTTLAWMSSYQPTKGGVAYYGGLGLGAEWHNRHALTMSEDGVDLPEDTDSTVYPLVDVGAMMPVVEHISLFVEWAYTDTWWVGVGVRVR